MINPDFAIILNFNPTGANVNADALVRRARDIGARAVSGREECEFVFENGVLTVQLKKQESPFAWQLVRIQGHRPEDDITETKF